MPFHLDKVELVGIMSEGTKFLHVPEGWEGAEPGGPEFSQLLDPPWALERDICPGTSARSFDKASGGTKLKMHICHHLSWNRC